MWQKGIYIAVWMPMHTLIKETCFKWNVNLWYVYNHASFGGQNGRVWANTLNSPAYGPVIFTRCSRTHAWQNPSCPIIDNLNLYALLHVTPILGCCMTENSDNWRLGRVRLAAVWKQSWWTVLPLSPLRHPWIGDFVRCMVATIGRRHFLQYSIHMHWFINPKLGVHIAAASIYLLNEDIYS